MIIKMIAGCIILSVLNMDTLASCLVRVQKQDESYMVTTWNHSEDKGDEIEHRFFRYDQIKIIAGLLKDTVRARFVFNNGTFTSMDYWDGKTRKWGQLSNAEKDAVIYIQTNLDITEKK